MNRPDRPGDEWKLNFPAAIKVYLCTVVCDMLAGSRGVAARVFSW